MSGQFAAMAALLACGIAGPAHGEAAVDVQAIERAAHDGYVAAINSDDLDTFLADLTADPVFQSPGEPEIDAARASRPQAVIFAGIISAVKSPARTLRVSGAAGSLRAG